MQYNIVQNRKIEKIGKNGSSTNVDNIRNIRELNMDIDSSTKYLDICIIDQYAEKSFEDGYTLSVDDIPEHEISHLLDRLMKEDTNVRDLVLYHIQKMIDVRLPEKEVEDRDASNIRMTRPSNGDYRLQYNNARGI